MKKTTTSIKNECDDYIDDDFEVFDVCLFNEHKKTTKQQNNKKKQLNPMIFSVKERCYLKQINDFFEDCSDEQIDLVMNIIKSGYKKNKDVKSRISLRALDWFVTKYSKRIPSTMENNVELFEIRISYKSQLKSCKKEYFDPFRRTHNNGIIFDYNFPNTDKIIETTLCQLNFFKWALSNNVLEYVKKNLKTINKEMTIANQEAKKNKKTKKSSESESSEDSSCFKNKKQQMSFKTAKFLKDGETKIVLKFD